MCSVAYLYISEILNSVYLLSCSIELSSTRHSRKHQISCIIRKDEDMNKRNYSSLPYKYILTTELT